MVSVVSSVGAACGGVAPLVSPAIGRAIALHAISPAPATHTGSICTAIRSPVPRGPLAGTCRMHTPRIAIGPDPCGGHAPAAQGRRGVAVAHTVGVQQCRRQQRVALRQPQISGVSNSNRSQWPTIASPKSSGPLRVHWPWSLRAIKFQAGMSMCMKRGCAGGEKSPARCDVQRGNEAVVWMDVVRSVQCRVRASSANGGRRHSKSLQPSPRRSAQYTSRR
ncbi:hypothetical protein XTPLMG730_2912 [Xanthomonas translucens pv. phlei]|uniref:Uncharacterized protein n=1 Tax=Xanthomonas graminis pv. phlei TaxID=487906 RepID=A0A0K2ZYG1_9XANT|nr:hypothetical protein XTPLMG730_2912 [Xanthomonas translucens pv. phlei]